MKTKVTRVKWTSEEWAAVGTAFEMLLGVQSKPTTFGALARKAQSRAKIKPSRRRNLFPAGVIAAGNEFIADAWFHRFPEAKRKTNGSAERGGGVQASNTITEAFNPLRKEVLSILNEGPGKTEVLIAIGKFTFTWDEARLVNRELMKILPRA